MSENHSTFKFIPQKYTNKNQYLVFMAHFMIFPAVDGGQQLKISSA